jgi:hypothetical protein
VQSGAELCTLPSQINIRAGGSIDAIQLFYGGSPGGHHGREGGELHRLRLFQGDRIVRVTGRAGLGPGAGVDQLTLHTSQGRTLGPFGGTGGLPFDTGDWGRRACSLGFVSGWADRRLDSLTLHWRCPAPPKRFHVVEGRGGSGGARSDPASGLLLLLLLLLR